MGDMTDPTTALAAALLDIEAALEIGRDTAEDIVIGRDMRHAIEALSVVRAALSGWTLVKDEESLDAAWKAAEAALPEGWEFVEIKAYNGVDGLRVFARARLSSVLDEHGLLGGNEQSVWADAPAAALLALATLTPESPR